jgi:iron(III) transport system ATP-binding protein
VTALTLEALTKTFPRAGTVVDAINLKIDKGEFFTLLGPSGCGKSTILRMVGGFEEPTSGRILFNDRDVTNDPPNRRGIGFVFQNYALFPHMSVARNVAFGLEVRKLPAAKTNERVSALLQQVRLNGLEDARIDQLSGGQQQRVALARALVIDPELLLLDEPLSNLDAKLREETRITLRTLHTSTGVTTVYVTHDQAEAMALSDRLAVLNNGKIQQVGAPEQIYNRPENRFVANFIGVNNIVEATVARMNGSSVVLRFANGRELSIGAGQHAEGLALAPGMKVGACIKAESFKLTAQAGVFQGVLTDVEYSGSSRACVVRADVGELHVVVPSSDGRPEKGEAVNLAVREQDLHVVGPA